MLYRHSWQTSLQCELLGCFAIKESVRPRVGFNIRIRNPLEYNLVFLGLTGEISMRTRAGSLHLGVAHNLQQSSLYEPPYVLSQGDAQAIMILDLDWRALDQIEERRSEDLILTGSVRGLCACSRGEQKGSEQAVDSLMWVSGQIVRGNKQEFPVYQTEWLAVLGELGYGKRRIIEVTVLPPEEVGSEAIAHVQAADRAMAQGEYESVLVACRRALETVEKAVRESGRDLGKLFDSESKSECIDGIRRKLKEFLSKGAHPGSSVNRRDADFAQLLTKTLLAYITSAVTGPRES